MIWNIHGSIEKGLTEYLHKTKLLLSYQYITSKNTYIDDLKRGIIYIGQEKNEQSWALIPTRKPSIYIASKNPKSNKLHTSRSCLYTHVQRKTMKVITPSCTTSWATSIHHLSYDLTPTRFCFSAVKPTQQNKIEKSWKPNQMNVVKLNLHDIELCNIEKSICTHWTMVLRLLHWKHLQSVLDKYCFIGSNSRLFSIKTGQLNSLRATLVVVEAKGCPNPTNIHIYCLKIFIHLVNPTQQGRGWLWTIYYINPCNIKYVYMQLRIC